MPELADLFRQHRCSYMDEYGDRLLPSHKQAIWDITNCRTEALGGHLLECDCCGNLDYAYHSCKNRACPKCHGNDTEKWLKKRSNELLNVPYFHLVFTLPKELRNLVRKNQKILYGVLLKAAAEALMQLAKDPKYVGGKIGILAVLHTWTNALVFHPHCHCLVPGGGMAPDGRWLSANKKFLVPVKALSPIFRAKFLEMTQDKLPSLRIPKEDWDKDWVVYCKPTIQGASKVLQYLGRYVHRIAITNNRILSVDNGMVEFRYKKTQKHKGQWIRSWATMRLAAHQFMSRFLQHVPPKGLHKVRHYGFVSPANRDLLRQAQTILNQKDNSDNLSNLDEKNNTSPLPPGRKCRFCTEGTMVIVGILPRTRKGPQERPPP